MSSAMASPPFWRVLRKCSFSFSDGLVRQLPVTSSGVHAAVLLSAPSSAFMA